MQYIYYVIVWAVTQMNFLGVGGPCTNSSRTTYYCLYPQVSTYMTMCIRECPAVQVKLDYGYRCVWAISNYSGG